MRRIEIISFNQKLPKTTLIVALEKNYFGPWKSLIFKNRWTLKYENIESKLNKRIFLFFWILEIQKGMSTFENNLIFFLENLN